MEKEMLIDLVQRSQDGDMEAFEKLLLHAHTSVSYQCRKMLKNEQDAEDMTQEVLVTVYQKLDTLKEPAAFNKWLHQITASRCINVLTRTHVEFQIAEDEDGNSVLNTLEEMDEKKIPEKWLDTKETTRMIEEIVDGLPEVQRMCTLMFYYSELSVREISRMMKVSENTIKSRLNYARKAIKEKVLDYEKKGVRLYGLSPLPFLYYFLHKRKDEQEDPVAAQIMVNEILAQSAFAAAGVVNAAGSSAAGVGGAAASSAGTTGLFGTLGAFSTKVIAGIAAGLVAIGGITVAATAGDGSRQKQSFPTVVLEEQGDGSGLEDAALLETVEAIEIPVETDAATEPGGDKTASAGTDLKASPSGSTEEDTGDGTAEIDLTAHTHQYVVGYTQEPCCQEQGYTEYKCSLCGDYYYDDFTETLPHSYTATVVAPTAYSQGYTKYECTAVCSHMHANYSTFCLDTYITDYTDKLPMDADTSGCTHSFIETTITAATCYGEGIQKFTCENCGFAYTEVIPKYTEHEWVLEEGIATAPGCDWDGNEGYWCKHCRLWKPDDIIPALGHEYSTTVVEPTESTWGYTEFTCSRCGVSFKDNYTEMLPEGTASAHTHSYTTVVTAPACTTNGYTTYSCTCGHSYTSDEISATGHDYNEVVTAPTCEQYGEGYTTYTCKTCGYSYKDNYTPQLEHTMVETGPKEATCTTYGVHMTYECTECGFENFDYITDEPTGHSWSEWTVTQEATTASDGVETRTCSTCGATETQILAKLTETHTHNYTSQITEATCTEGGYTTYTCTCGDTYTDDITAATGHSYASNVVAPTETEQGYTEHTCTVCGDSYRDSYTDALTSE